MSRQNMFDEITRRALAKYSERAEGFSRINIQEGLSSLNLKMYEETRNKLIHKFSNEINRNDKDKLLYLFLNLFQSAYKLKEELLLKVNGYTQSNENLIDDNLYYTICLLIFKYEDPNYLPFLKETIIENNLNFEDIIEFEMLVLNKLNWNLFLDNPFDLTYLILSEISSKLSYDENFFHEVFNSIVDLISYCFSELSIYTSYNQFEILISCFVLVLEIYLKDNSLNEFEHSLIEQIQCNETLNRIHNCKLTIQKSLNKEENANHYDYELEPSNDESLSSLKDQKNEVDTNKFTINDFDNSVIHSNFSTLELDDENWSPNYCITIKANSNDLAMEFEVNNTNNRENSPMDA